MSKGVHSKLPHYTIRASHAYFDIDWRELAKYRDLLGLFVYRDLVAVYKQTILGPLWFIIQPLVTTLVFTVIFGNLAGISTDGMPKILFYMSGILLWNYFQSCMTSVGHSLINNANLFRKVYYPRLINPLATIVTNLAQLILNTAVFIFFFVYYHYFTEIEVVWSWKMLGLPLIVLQAALTGLGVGLCLATLTVKYRDLNFAVPFLSQLWMYATPVVYPLSIVPEKWRWLAILNPMVSIVEQCRGFLLGSGGVTSGMMALSWFTTILVLVLGLMFFHRAQKSFVDTI